MSLKADKRWAKFNCSKERQDAKYQRAINKNPRLLPIASRSKKVEEITTASSCDRLTRDYVMQTCLLPQSTATFYYGRRSTLALGRGVVTLPYYFTPATWRHEAVSVNDISPSKLVLSLVSRLKGNKHV